MERKIVDTVYRGHKSFLEQGICRTDEQENNPPDDECMDRSIDLNEQLIRNKSATFFFRMNGEAMTGAGIFSGDCLVVDRSITQVNGKVVVAVLNGEMMVRRLEKTINKIRLIPETAKLSPIEVDPFAAFSVWGVVTYVIHAL